VELENVFGSIETDNARRWHRSPSPATLATTAMRAESIPSGHRSSLPVVLLTR
jgi:hypothetical protein